MLISKFRGRKSTNENGQVQVRLEPSERKRPSRHQATQTETAASSAPHSVGVQTEAAASDGVASQSDGAGESVVLNSVDFLQPTLPDVRLAVLRPAEDDGDNIIVESDSEVILLFLFTGRNGLSQSPRTI